MKSIKKCPKCQNKNILEVSIKSFGKHSGTINAIRLGGFPTRNNLVPIETYICKECGYSEEWIDRSDISRIEQAYLDGTAIKKDQNFIKGSFASLGISLGCLFIAATFAFIVIIGLFVLFISSI